MATEGFGGSLKQKYYKIKKENCVQPSICLPGHGGEHFFCFKRSTDALLADLSEDSESDTEYAEVSDSSLGGDEEWGPVAA